MPELPTPQLENLLEHCEQSQRFPQHPLVPESRITTGTVNQCWKLRSGEDFYLARLGQNLPDNFLTHWQNELEISQLAANLGLAPEVIFFNPSSLAAVYAWAGEPVCRKSLNKVHLEALGHQLNKMHNLSPPAPHIGYRQTIQNYLDLIGERGAREEFGPELSELFNLADLWDQSPERCFCHHDLNQGNILWDGSRLRLIDWEYARFAHPLFDLATLSCHLDLSDDELQTLLDHYTARTFGLAQVREAELMVEGLGKLWHRAADIALNSC